MTNLTITLMTCGELTEANCVRAVPSRKVLTGSGWSPPLFLFNEVRNVYPASKALNTMVDQCETEYLVPLDSDMILHKNFLSRIKEAIIDHGFDSTWHSILFPLWDTLTMEKIMALKVFRTKVIKEFPFKDDPCPDIEHYKDLTTAGYRTVDLIYQDSIGDHVVKGCFFCYAKYRDLYLVTRSHPEIVLESHFKGGTDLYERADRHFDFFCGCYEMTRNPDYLYCMAGMIEGLTSELTFRSKDLSQNEMKVSLTEAHEIFNQWLKNKKRSMFL